MKISLIIFSLVNSVILFAQDLSQKEATTRALVVGISDYQDPNIPDLQFAHKDAELFAEYLTSDDGGQIPKKNITLLTNSNATISQIAMALNNVLLKSQKGDEVIIYFAGHGDVENNSVTQSGFLLCWDAPSKIYLAGGAFSLHFLNEVMLKLDKKNVKVLLIADTSHAGKLSGNLVNGTKLTTANLIKPVANETRIISCQPGEYSIEGTQWGGGHGAFTYYLVKGLKGAADMDNDKNINLLEIDLYLEDILTKEVAPQKQRPITSGNRSTVLSSPSG